MDFKSAAWVRRKRIGLYFTSDQIKKKASVARASVSALIFGFALGIIVISLNGYNGFSFIGELFRGALNNDPIFINGSVFSQTLMYFSAYFLIGLGISLGFRVGMFNMGGSGQAVLGMAFACQLLYHEGAHVTPGYAVVVVLVFALSGILVSSIAGFLKAFLNVHEVVTTIMLNWIVWYLFQWFDSNVISQTSGLPGTNDVTADPVSNGNIPAQWFNIGHNQYAFGLILVALAIITVWGVLTFTTFGFKFKVVGAQKDAAKYAGINAKFYIVLTTAIQGLLIGLGSLIYYFQIMGKIETKQGDLVPTIGFDALTIPLVAFNNIFGMIPIAFIWAIIKSGMDPAVVHFQGLTRESGSLMYGFIVYGAAIYVMFLKIKPWQWIKTQIATMWDWRARIQIDKFKNNIRLAKIRLKYYKFDPEILSARNKMIAAKEAMNKTSENGAKDKSQYYAYRKLRKIYHFELRSARDSIVKMIRQWRYDIRFVRGKALQNFVANKKTSVTSRYFGFKKTTLYETLDYITRESINYRNRLGIYDAKIVDTEAQLNESKANVLKLETEIAELHQDNIKKADILKLEAQLKETKADILKLEPQLSQLRAEAAEFKKQENDEYNFRVRKLISDHNETVAKAKVQYKQNKITVNEEFARIKIAYNSDYASNKASFVSDKIAKDRTISEITNNLNTTIVGLKATMGSNNEEKVINQIWEAQNKTLAEVSKNFLDLSSTKLYKTMTSKLDEETGVVNQYGRY